MKVVIIEDEAPASRRLIKLLDQTGINIEISAILESVSQSKKWFLENPAPDLIFSDIQLADNLSFEIFNHIEVRSPIIFITAFDQYAIRAFEHLSIDYLLKPVRLENLQKSLEKYKKLTHPVTNSINTAELLRMISRPEYRERFLVYSGDNLLSIKIDEIAYFYSEDGTSFLATCEKKRFILNESLDKIEKELDPKNFFRANRQFLVSISGIAKVSPYFNQKLLITLNPSSEIELVVSKLKATEFKNWLNL
jgi:two-component system, LytTR family, response regulator LytT